jgi:hypothetical protein
MQEFFYKHENYLSCYTHDVTLKDIVNVGALHYVTIYRSAQTPFHETH